MKIKLRYNNKWKIISLLIICILFAGVNNVQANEDSYTIRYNVNGGSESTPGNQTKTYGTALTLKTYNGTKLGYTFAGWSTSSTATSAIWSSGGTMEANYSLTQDITLYAVWTPNSYTVSYNLNGGNGTTPSNQTKTYGTTLTLRTYSGTKTGYTFGGWSTSSIATTAMWSSGGTMGANEISINTTLYAVWIPNSYTVSYNLNGGSGSTPSNQTKINGTALTLQTYSGTKTGHIFVGWSTSSSATSATWNSGGIMDSDYIITEAVTLYAVWTADNYTVSYNLNGGNGAIPSSQIKTYGAPLTLRAYTGTKTGYTFLGWSASNTATSATWSSGGTMGANDISSNTILYAVWTPNTYTVSYDVNGGSGEAPASQTKTYGNTLELQSYTETSPSYTYGGWSTSDTGTGATYYSNGATMGESDISSDIVLYAVRTPNAYTITYNINGGSGTAPENQSKTYGETLTLRTYNGTKTGYTFAGWSTSSNATNITWTNGGTMGANDISTNVTLYAVWLPNSYTITYNINGGNGTAPSSQTKTYGTALMLKTYSGAKAGYEFVGWSTSSTATDAMWISGGTMGANDISTNVTLYAVWNPYKYTVSYDIKGGSGTPPVSQTKTYGSSLTLATYIGTKAGYTFAGWSTSTNATEVTYNNGATMGANDITANTTLYAVWSSATYTVTYDINGGDGTVPSSQTKKHGASLVLQTYNGTKTGYTFAGWSIYASATVAMWNNGGIMGADDISTDTVLYAVWIPKTYTVSYNANGGNGDIPNSQTKIYGTSLNLRTYSGQKVGHEFIGWATTGATTTANWVNGGLMGPNAIEESVTLYAVWIPSTYTVSYDTNGGTGVAPSNQTKVYGSTLQLSHYNGVKEGYRCIGWSLSPMATQPTWRMGDYMSETEITSNVMLYAVWIKEQISTPILLSGMKPVVYNGTTWVETTETDSNWYNYNEGRMANVKLTDGSMYVWVPRYTYMIQGETIRVKWSNDTQDDTTEGYIAHPAFNYSGYNGGNTSTSENYSSLTENEKLPGLWVAKYEARNNSGKIKSVSSGSRWTNISISSMFDYSKAMVSNLSSYGLTAPTGTGSILDSHLMKNSEWGAIIYLQKAIAPVNESGVKEIDTGNEYVAAYNELIGGTVNSAVRTNGASLKNADVKHVDIIRLTKPYDQTTTNYESYANYYGNAIAETSSISGETISSIGNKTCNIPYKQNPFVVRTQDFGFTSGSGAASSSIGFRNTLIVKTESVGYNVTIQRNNAGGTVTGNGRYKDGTMITVGATPQAGYTFSGWEVISGGVSLSTATERATTFQMPQTNVTIKANFTAQQYNINYNINGGSGTAPSSQTKTYGQALTLNTYNGTKDGYAFGGWSTSSTATEATWGSGGTMAANYAMTQDITLYAVWVSSNYSISYSTNGGSGSAPASQTKTYGTALTLRTYSGTKNGYTFGGWSTDSNTTSATWSSGGVMAANYTLTQNTILYAVWMPNGYTITYNANGGSTVAPSSQTKVYGTELTLRTYTGTKAGHTLLGWSTSNTATEAMYGNGATLPANYQLTQNITLYAVWRANAYTVTYSQNGGSGSAPASQTKTYGTALTLRTYTGTMAGHVFLGWSTSNAATEATWASGGTMEANYLMTEDIVLYAVWSPNGYTISYNLNGGDGAAPSNQTKVYGTALTLRSYTTPRSGYTFLGWSTSNTATEATWVSGGVMVADYLLTENITLYAVWKPESYTITYNLNGATGSAPDSQTKVYGTALTLRTYSGSRTGYTLLGWSTSNIATDATWTNGGTMAADYLLTGHTVLYAVWRPDSCTISYNLNGATGTTPDSQTKVYGTALTLRTYSGSRTGYTFLGWSTSSSATSATWSNGGAMAADHILTGNTVLYAVWSANGYTISYNLNGATGTVPDSQTKVYGTALTLRGYTGTKAGYTFLGWSTSASATSATWSSGGTMAADYILTGNTILYAVWSPNAYTLTVVIDGEISEETTIYCGEEVTVTAESTGTEIFTGWTATGMTVTNTTSTALRFEMPASNVTLTGTFSE